MGDEQNIVVIPKDSAEIARLELTTELERVLQQGVTPIVETITGLFASGKWGAAAAGGRIVQGALKYKLFQQVSKEIQDLRAKGKIADDFAEKKYAFNSWKELFTVIDEETPDEDRLEALKAMFYAVNKINSTDGERIASYQLFQIAKRLTSGQLLLLKVAHERAKDWDFKPDSNLGARGWLEAVSRRLGHQIVGLVEQDERVLIQNGLLTARFLSDDSGINDGNGRLTPLAFTFCEKIRTYHADVSQAEQRAAS
jgi:hypothetical protein